MERILSGSNRFPASSQILLEIYHQTYYNKPVNKIKKFCGAGCNLSLIHIYAGGRAGHCDASLWIWVSVVCAGGVCAAVYSAVSYTHLDVYKRQM